MDPTGASQGCLSGAACLVPHLEENHQGQENLGKGAGLVLQEGKTALVEVFAVSDPTRCSAYEDLGCISADKVSGIAGAVPITLPDRTEVRQTVFPEPPCCQ